ncbi:hypothetical protein J7T55_011696 [Diaporthe amygdali]|uniref:uncharacterized protein n=1 Tax=Phomopsis amygdali TaxID=1214568 RepID=UPI0022FDF678|nr:uncharacterized protein J7T55_011696 [Diaporthe amygdali]KAJ0123232.1 hypothetical protein J7T55_011696 [Diaporthe amygdali]
MSDRKKKHEKKDKKRQHSSSSSPASHASSHRHDDHSAGHRHHSKKKVSSSSQNPSQTAEKYVQSSSGKATKHSGEHSHSSTSKGRSSSGQPAQSSSVTVRHFPQNPSHHSGTHGYSSSVPSSHLAGDFNQSASGHPSSGQNKQSSTDKDVPKHFTGNMMENLAELHNTSFGAMHTIPGNWNENNDDPLSNINLATPSPCYSKSSGRSSSSASSISETRLPQSIMNPSVRENIGSETMTNVPSNCVLTTFSNGDSCVSFTTARSKQRAATKDTIQVSIKDLRSEQIPQ